MGDEERGPVVRSLLYLQVGLTHLGSTGGLLLESRQAAVLPSRKTIQPGMLLSRLAACHQAALPTLMQHCQDMGPDTGQEAQLGSKTGVFGFTQSGCDTDPECTSLPFKFASQAMKPDWTDAPTPAKGKSETEPLLPASKHLPGFGSLRDLLHVAQLADFARAKVEHLAQQS